MLNFSNSTNWTLIHNANYVANVANDSGNHPYIIGEKILPLISSCHYIAVKTSWNNPINTNWINAGVLRRKVITNLPSEEPQNIYLRGNTRILLNDFTFIQYDDYSGSVSLSFTPHDWIQHLDVKIWQYIGIESTSNNVDLTPVTNALATLQTSVNYLNELIGG